MKNRKILSLEQIKHDVGLVGRALIALADLGIFVSAVKIRADGQPSQVHIDNTKAVHRLPPAFTTGRGRNNDGNLYTSKAAQFEGVLVMWNELH